MSLRDWLDAGYVMLVSDTDATARQLLEALFASESDEDLRQGFDDLKAEMAFRSEQARRADQEHRRKSGAPSAPKRVPQKVLDDALAEWVAITSGRDPDAPTAEAEEAV